MSNSHGFTLGMIAEYRGQKYRLIDVRPYRRLDGRDSQIMVWRSRCMTCGALFETTTPFRELTKATRRCSAHVQRTRQNVRAVVEAYVAGTLKLAAPPETSDTNRDAGRSAPPAYHATNRVRVRGQRLSPIIWQGRQWAVTKHGIECRDGTYAIAKSRLWEGWERHMAEKEWVDQADLAEALRIARQVHAKQAPGTMSQRTGKRGRAPT
ncbi:hypothetical protein [Bradyrhizobium sp. Ai1a-2]|uniref:hypothetical protein n=1 Tax=Bradyrhizobium sp. Ai1a-2 TaxID=196490 RepID=UPI0003FAB0BC|nr:hypothetical protein [Bradyrhizobium sp. Ai1a-2]